MPEQITGPNTGVGTATDGGGGNNMNNQGTPQTQGGGAAFSGAASTGSTGSSGTSTTPSAGDNLGGLTVAIAGLTAITAGFLPSDEDILEIFMNKKMGFDTLEEDVANENPDIPRQQIKDMVAEQRIKVKAFLSGPGKAAFKDKLDSLKQEIKKITDGAKDIGKEVTTAATEAAMPPVVGPVAPNPVSVVIKFSLVITRIMGMVGLILAAVIMALKLMDELGLSDNPAAEKIKEAAKPILEVEERLKALAEKFKKDAEESKDTYSDVHPAAGTNGIAEDARITSEELKIEAASKFKIAGEWPLARKDRKKVKKLVKSNDENEAEWGEAFWDYHRWLKTGKLKDGAKISDEMAAILGAQLGGGFGLDSNSNNPNIGRRPQ